MKSFADCCEDGPDGRVQAGDLRRGLTPRPARANLLWEQADDEAETAIGTHSQTAKAWAKWRGGAGGCVRGTGSSSGDSSGSAGSDDEGAGHHQDADVVCGSVCPPGYAVAMGVSADHQRVSAEDDASELRLHRSVSALRLQLERRESLPADEGVLPGGLCADDAVCGGWTLVSGRVLGGRRRRKSAERRGNLSADSVRQRVLPEGLWQGQRRVHAAGLLRVSGVAAEHPGALRREGIFDAEAERGVAAGAEDWWAGLTRADSGGYSVQCRAVDGTGRQECSQCAEPGRVWKQYLHGYLQGAGAAARTAAAYGRAAGEAYAATAAGSEPVARAGAGLGQADRY